MTEGAGRKPWYERFGGIGGSGTASQSIRRTGIPVPQGGTFQGRPPPRRREQVDEDLEALWSAQSRADRRAEVTTVDWLTRTGTLRLGFDVVDGRPFSFQPGNLVRVEAHVPGKGYHRGTYCIAVPPSEYHRFELLVRVVEGGRMSAYLATLRLGDEVAFRGPAGRSMARFAAGGPDLVLIATGVGVAPLYSLASTLLRAGDGRRVDLYWGLRTTDDLCLTAELDRLADAHDNFRHHVSLSQPDGGWTGLRGRVTESVPAALPPLETQRFILAGNGAMIEEFSAALQEIGVLQEAIYEEAYFSARHVPDPEVVAAIVERFPAGT